MLGLIYQTLNTFTLRTWYQSTQPIVVNPPTTTHCYLLPTTTMVDPLRLTFDLATLTWAPTTMICGWRSHPMLVIFSWVSWHQIDAAWPQAHHGFTHPPLATHHSPHTTIGFSKIGFQPWIYMVWIILIFFNTFIFILCLLLISYFYLLFGQP